MRFGVVIFPGSNCEQDVIHACRYLGFDASYVWHGDTDLSGYDAVVLGCTELPLIVRPDDSPLPTLDSTRLLARAALKRAAKEK